MDTKQRNREAEAKRPANPDARKRPAQSRQGAATTRQRAAQEQPRAKRPAAQQSAPKRPAEQKHTPQPGKAVGTKNAAAPKKQAAAPKKQAAPVRQQGLPDSVSNKKRAYGRTKPKKKTVFTAAGSLMKSAGKALGPKSEEQKARQEAKAVERAKKNKQPINAPAVIYTEPLPFNRNRLLVQLITVAAVVLAVVLGLSVFFKVETITVTGAEVYSAWSVREASGISEGDNLLTFSRARASGQIKANLPYVDKVRIGIKLPNTVNIMIEEEDVVYAIQTDDGTWWLMNSNGRMVEQTNSAVAKGYTQVMGVTLSGPVSGQQAVAAEEVPTETDLDGELIPITVTGAMRLNAALQILKALEANDIVGDAASVNVSQLEDMVLWYGTRYQVNLGDTSNIDYKIACMNDAVLQMSDYDSGILDISFTNMPDKVIYTPFE